MKRACLIGLLIAVLVAPPMASWAGVKMKIGDTANVDLGFRVQTEFYSTNNEGSNAAGESANVFDVRRARFRLGGNVTKWVKFFLQTNTGLKESSASKDVTLIDAWIALNLHELAQIYTGQHMAPSGREQLTSSGGLMTVGRSPIHTYNLTWGVRGVANFTNSGYSDSDQTGISTSIGVRDLGATVFGSTSLTDMAHLKYYAGIYEGIPDNATNKDSQRFTLRAQLNFFDPEPGYFNLATYMDKKKTIGIGASFDTQKDVATEVPTNKDIDYTWWELDFFVNYPIGPGAATFQALYQDLDLDDANQLNNASPGSDAEQTQGKGFDLQAGYYLTDYQVQIWGEFSDWDSDGSNDVGDFNCWRVGATYFFAGHNAKILAGFENFNAKEKIGGTADDNVTNFIIHFATTF